jgi:ABC-type branched-subunit amino acid transport system ATPase component
LDVLNTYSFGSAFKNKYRIKRFLHALEVLENGAIALEGTGKELLANAHVKKAFFGM